MITDLQKTAMESLCHVAETEANVLAHLLDDDAFKAHPLRVKIAIENEMKRLRKMADTVKPLFEKPESP